MEKAVFKPVHNRRNVTGLSPIEIYCYHLGQKKYLSTKINIEPSQWDKRKRKVNDTHLNHHKLNYQITRLIADLEQYEIEMMETSGRFTLDDLDKFRKTENPTSFIAFMDLEIKKDVTVATSTRGYRNRTLKYLKAAVGDISFKNLDYDAICEFDNYMVENGLSTSTRQKNHNQVKKFAQIAVNKRKLPRSPYMLYKIKRAPKQLKKCLWYDDLERIWELKYNGSYEVVRLRFLFSAWTGLRISDNGNIKKGDIRNGKIMMRMQKTGMWVVTPVDVIDERANVIMERCMSKDREHIFEKMSDVKVNEILKKIGIDAEVAFPLNFHVARHTFCTLVAHKTGSVFDVMRYSGLAKTDTAMEYVNLAKLFSV